MVFLRLHMQGMGYLSNGHVHCKDYNKLPHLLQLLALRLSPIFKAQQYYYPDFAKPTPTISAENHHLHRSASSST
jgi:hypothetical protein